jgi:hypothetical protein
VVSQILKSSRSTKMFARNAFVRVVAVVALCCSARTGATYSVQSHEQLIDLTWQRSIRPLLLSRYPNLTEAQIQEAHAYAYGGCAIQDLGYYPFGKELFSDLTHYVRSGDFIVALFRDSTNADELAFAVGALSHYIGDNIGHSEATNAAVALEFPDLARKYGPIVTYAESEHAHVRTEFAFDIDEVSKGRFAPLKYLNHVGLKVPQPLLERAFFETYGLDMRRALGFNRPVVKGYRFGVRSFLPRIAYAEAVLHRNRFPADTQSEAAERLRADLAQAATDNKWEPYRRTAGIGTHMLAYLIFVLPKVGVLSSLAIKGPTPDTQAKYVDSVNRSADALRLALGHFSALLTSVPNRDLDTGQMIKPGGYLLTDQTYAKLLGLLTDKHKGRALILPLGLKENVLAYYADPTSPISTKKDAKKWAKVQVELGQLAALEASPNPVYIPGPDPDAAPAPTPTSATP